MRRGRLKQFLAAYRAGKIRFRLSWTIDGVVIWERV